MPAGTYRAFEPIGVFQMLVLAKGHFRTSRLPGGGVGPGDGLGGGLEPGGGGAGGDGGTRASEVLQAIKARVVRARVFRMDMANFTRCSVAVMR